MKGFSYRTLVAILLSSVLLSSCSYKQFYAAVTSRGTIPDDTSYYISHDMGEDVDYLEFKEYAQLLKNNLNDIGYHSQNETSAKLNIHLNYYIGNKEVVSSSSSTSNYSVNSTTWKGTSNKNTTSNATASAIGFSNYATASGSGTSNTKTTANVNKNSYTYGGSSTSTTTEAGSPCYLILEAVNTTNNLPEWKVEIEGFIDSPSSFPKVMPWMMLVAKWYIGKTYSGKVEVQTTNFLHYNLPDVFDSDTWSLQYHYFGSSDIFIKEDPLK